MDMSSQVPEVHDVRHMPWNYIETSDAPQIVPTRVPITPFVKLDDLRPEDEYDVRPAYGTPVNTNKIKETWFDADTKDAGFRNVKFNRMAKHENPQVRKLINRMWTRNAFRSIHFPRRD